MTKGTFPACFYKLVGLSNTYRLVGDGSKRWDPVVRESRKPYESFILYYWSSSLRVSEKSVM